MAPVRWENVTHPGQPYITLNDTINVIAVPDRCQRFEGWSGDLSGNASPTQLVMDSDKSVTATFKDAVYTLETQTQGEGTIAFVTPSAPQATYACDTKVTLQATPAADWFFNSWNGELGTADNPVTLNMDQDYVVTAIFAQEEFTLNVNSKPVTGRYGYR